MGFKEDFYNAVWKDLTDMTFKEQVKMWLTHDLKMYDDVLAILEITAAGIIWNEYHHLYVIFKIFYSIAIVTLNVPNNSTDDFPYPHDDLDDTEERQLTDQMRDDSLTTGIDFRSIGKYVGNLWALITMPQPEEETIEIAIKTDATSSTSSI